MTGVTPEQMSAYLDGELSGTALKSVEAALAADPSLAARFAALKDADAHLRAAFGGPETSPIPARLEALLRDPTLAPARPRLRSLRFSPAHLASLAASLVVGVVVGRVVLMSADDAPASYALNAGGVAVASREVGRALDQARTGEIVRVADQSMAVRLTFKDLAGRYCREFQLGGGVALVCRSNEGWALEAMASIPAATSSSGYSMAEGPVAAELDAARKRIGAAEVLDAAGEAGAIASNWGKPRP